MARDFKVLRWARAIPTMIYVGSSYYYRKGYGNGSNDYFEQGMGQFHTGGDGWGGGSLSEDEGPNGSGGGPYYGGHGY